MGYMTKLFFLFVENFSENCPLPFLQKKETPKKIKNIYIIDFQLFSFI